MTHSVFFWLKEGLSADEVAKFESGAQALLDIDVVKSGMVGKPADTPVRPVTDNSFSYSLILHFDSIENHNIYQDHPDHDVFVDGCKDLWDRVLVMDSDPV